MITGEEQENCVLQVRVKLFKLVVTSVAAAAASKGGDSDSDGDNNGSKLAAQVGGVVREWAEVGVGPLRVLKSKDAVPCPDARVVMRREGMKGGQGTKVLLNLKIREYTSCKRQGDKALCVSTFVPASETESDAAAAADGGGGGAPVPVSYMLRCKLASETAQIASALEKEIAGQKSK